MTITDKQVDESCRKLAIAFGVTTTEELVKEMVSRFLRWKLPRDFYPDAGISFNPEYNVEYMAKRGLPPSIHEPLGTNLFHAGQAEEMVRHILGLPNIMTCEEELNLAHNETAQCGLPNGHDGPHEAQVKQKNGREVTLTWGVDENEQDMGSKPRYDYNDHCFVYSGQENPNN